MSREKWQKTSNGPKYLSRGKKLAEWRALKGRGKLEIARLLETDPSSYTKYEAGVLDPMNLSSALLREGCDLNWLCADDSAGLPLSLREHDHTYGNDIVAEVFDSLAKEMGKHYTQRQRAKILGLARQLEREYMRVMLAGLIGTQSGVKRGKRTIESTRSSADKDGAGDSDAGGRRESSEGTKTTEH